MKKKNVSKKFISFILCLLITVGTMCSVPMTASAASYPKISALKISRVYQSNEEQASGMCYWASMATVQGYCLGTYTYGGITTSYRTGGKDYNFVSKNDAVSKKLLSSYNGYANSSTNLNSYPVKMTLITGCGNNSTTYEKIYNQLKLGKPVIVYKTGGNTPHASVVIGYNGSSSTLEASGFTVLEVKKDGNWWSNSSSYYNSYANKPQVDSNSGGPMSCYVTLSSWINYGGGSITQICYPTNAVSESSGSGGSTSAVNFTSVWADNITKTDAQINANFDLTYISGCGFYIGTSSSSLKKVSKNLAGQADGAGNFKNIFYKMSKWYGTLSPNTTYYYKLYVIKDGKEYCTAVKSFKTLPNTYTVSYNANGGSGAPASQTKTQGTTLKLSTTIPTRSGYIFKGWATSSSGSVVYNAGGSYTKDAAITLYAVWEKIATVTGVSINENYVNANMSLGETVLFEATVYPQNAENKNLIWSSPSENVSVTEDGCVTALDCGEAEIIVTTEDGGFSDSVFIYIWHEVGGIDISEDSLALGLGESYDLSYEVYSEGECLYMAEWVSSDESVITVDESGTVTPVGEGTATVTLVVTDVAHVNYSVQFEDSVEITVSDVSHEEKSILDIILGILMAPVNLIVGLFKLIFGLFK